MNETRNQLIIIKNLKKEIDKNGDIDFQFAYLLERFRMELEANKKDLEYELNKVIKNLEILEQVEKEVLK